MLGSCGLKSMVLAGERIMKIFGMVEDDRVVKASEVKGENKLLDKTRTPNALARERGDESVVSQTITSTTLSER